MNQKKINPDIIRQLKNSTGAGLKHCKDAIYETNGDFKEAISLLKKRNIIKSAKYTQNEALEGGIAVFENDKKIIMVKIFCQTDFTAKSEGMKKVFNHIKSHIFGNVTLESLKEKTNEFIKEISAATSENIFIEDMKVFIKDSSHYPFFYIHNPYFEGFGNICGVVSLSENDKHIGEEIALHIVSEKPKYLSEKDIPLDILEAEKNTAIAASEGNERKVEGMINKFKKENCLLNQNFIFGKLPKITSMLGKITINDFCVFSVK